MKKRQIFLKEGISGNLLWAFTGTRSCGGISAAAVQGDCPADRTGGTVR